MVWDNDAERSRLHENLWICFQTGQMNERQLETHMSEDKEFRSFVEKKRASHNSLRPPSVTPPKPES